MKTYFNNRSVRIIHYLENQSKRQNYKIFLEMNGIQSMAWKTNKGFRRFLEEYNLKLKKSYRISKGNITIWEIEGDTILESILSDSGQDSFFRMSFDHSDIYSKVKKRWDFIETSNGNLTLFRAKIVKEKTFIYYLNPNVKNRPIFTYKHFKNVFHN